VCLGGPMSHVERQLQRAIDNAPTATAFVGHDGRIRYVNKAMCALMGRDEAMLLAGTWADVTHPEDMHVSDDVAAQLRSGEIDIVHDRKRYVRLDGSVFWADVSVSRVRDENGEPAFNVAQILDITQVVAAQDALAASEERYRLLAENASDVVTLVNTDGTLEWVSPSVQTLIGWEPDEIIGTRPWDLVHPDDVAPAAQSMASAADPSTEPEKLTLRLKRPDGSYVWVSAAGRRLSPDRLVVSYRVVDDQVRAEQALAESEARYRLLAENATDVVYSTDPDGRLTWVSPAVARVLGWTPEELIGVPSADLSHPDDRVAIEEARRRTYSGSVDGLPTTAFILRTRTKSGDYRWMSNTITIVRDASGAVTGVVGGLALVDDLVEARARAVVDEELLRVASDAMLDPQVLFEPVRDEQGRIVDLAYLAANRATCAYLGRTVDELVGASMLESLPGMVEAGLLERYADVIETREPLALEAFRYHNEILDIDAYYDIRGAYVTGDRLSLTWRDVTVLHEATQRIADSEEQYRLLAENSSDVVARIDAAGDCAWVSPSLRDMLGWEPGEWIGRSSTDFVHPDDLRRLLAQREGMLDGSLPMEHGTWITRFRARSSDGRYHWIETHSRPFVGADGQRDGVVLSFRVVDTEVEAERELERRARFDELTGVLKREEILERLAESGRYTRRTGEDAAVVFIDIDSFKDVNDQHGHSAGDELLRTLARRIRENVRSGDTVARMGGDEFLVLLDGVHSLAEAHAIAEKLRLACAGPVATRGGDVSATVSIGVTLSRPGEEVDAMVARADHAMYEAKRSGRNRVIAVPLL
jgi:diguanylate cyclase (GGDEF)-like protein/PAS domain S-box-containing protein